MNKPFTYEYVLHGIALDDSILSDLRLGILLSYKIAERVGLK